VRGKAGAEYPRRRDPEPVAGRTERVARASDEAHPQRRIAARSDIFRWTKPRLDLALLGEEMLGEHPLHLRRGDKVVGHKLGPLGDRHDLEEARHHAPFPGPEHEPLDLIVVHPPKDDRVEFDRVEPSFERRLDPGEHPAQIAAPGYLPEAGFVE